MKVGRGRVLLNVDYTRICCWTRCTLCLSGVEQGKKSSFLLEKRYSLVCPGLSFWALPSLTVTPGKCQTSFRITELTNKWQFSTQQWLLYIQTEKPLSQWSFPCRPIVKECEAHIYIKQGRHPVLDTLLPENEQFVPNDTHMDVSQC